MNAITTKYNGIVYEKLPMNSDGVFICNFYKDGDKVDHIKSKKPISTNKIKSIIDEDINIQEEDK